MACMRQYTKFSFHGKRFSAPHNITARQLRPCAQPAITVRMAALSTRHVLLVITVEPGLPLLSNTAVSQGTIVPVAPPVVMRCNAALERIVWRTRRRLKTHSASQGFIARRVPPMALNLTAQLEIIALRDPVPAHRAPRVPTCPLRTHTLGVWFVQRGLSAQARGNRFTRDVRWVTIVRAVTLLALKACASRVITAPLTPLRRRSTFATPVNIVSPVPLPLPIARRAHSTL
jgi:hypothetical protein